MGKVALVICALSLVSAPPADEETKVDVKVSMSHGMGNISYTHCSGGSVSTFKYPLDLKPFSHAKALDKAETVFAKSAFDGTYDRAYLVMRLTGPSRLTSDGNGYCGAGEEINLVWLELQEAVILNAKSVLCTSCFQDLYIDKYDLTANGLKVQCSDAGGEEKFSLVYDNEKPEQGFSISSQGIEKAEKK